MQSQRIISIPSIATLYTLQRGRFLEVPLHLKQSCQFPSRHDIFFVDMCAYLLARVVRSRIAVEGEKSTEIEFG